MRSRGVFGSVLAVFLESFRALSGAVHQAGILIADLATEFQE
jgi:hypothetical protein